MTTKHYNTGGFLIILLLILIIFLSYKEIVNVRKLSETLGKKGRAERCSMILSRSFNALAKKPIANPNQLDDKAK